MKVFRLRIIQAILAVGLLSGLAGAQTLTIAHNVDPHTFNPLMTTTAAVESVILATVEKLAVFEDGSTAPWLLDGWDLKSDTVLELHLKQGIMFTNGEPLDAEAVRFSLEAWREQPIMAQGIVGFEDATFEVVDESTVRITTMEPVPGILTMLGRYGYVVPPVYYAEVGAEGFGTAPIGTGPYIFERHASGDSVEFSRNDAYWGGTPGFEKVVFRIMPEEFSRAAALEAGEVDIAYLLSDTSVARLKGVPGVVVHSQPGLRKFIAAFNAEMPGGEPLADPAVRRALNHAVDVNAIVDALYDGEAAILGGEFALPAEFGYSDAIEPFGYDLELARSMLAEAGYADGFPVTFAYPVGRYPKDQEVGEILTSYLEGAGLTITPKPLEWGAFLAERKARTLGHIFFFGLLFAPDLDDTFNYMAFGKEARGAPLLTWSDEWWALYEASSTMMDPAARAEAYAQMLEIDREAPYGIYLFAPNDVYGTTEAITGFQPREDQFLFLYNVRPSN